MIETANNIETMRVLEQMLLLTDQAVDMMDLQQKAI